MPGEENKITVEQAVIRGKLREFIPGDDVELYLDHVDDFFELNRDTVSEDHQALYFLNAIGATPFEKVSIACRPDKASTK